MGRERNGCTVPVALIHDASPAQHYALCHPRPAHALLLPAGSIPAVGVSEKGGMTHLNLVSRRVVHPLHRLHRCHVRPGLTDMDGQQFLAPESGQPGPDRTPERGIAERVTRRGFVLVQDGCLCLDLLLIHLLLLRQSLLQFDDPIIDLQEFTFLLAQQSLLEIEFGILVID